MHPSSNKRHFNHIVSIKGFCHTYRGCLVLVVGLVICLGFGLMYWQRQTAGHLEQAAFLFEQLLHYETVKVDRKQEKLSAEALVQHYNDTPYAVFAHLTLAKLAAQDHDLKRAQKSLEEALEHTRHPELRTIIKLRKARVLIEAQSYKSALSVLDDIEHPAHFLSFVQLLKHHATRLLKHRSEDALPLERLFQTASDDNSLAAFLAASTPH